MGEVGNVLKLATPKKKIIGWERVGFISYLLNNLWSTRLQANKTTINVQHVNRVGNFKLALKIMGGSLSLNSKKKSTIFFLVPFLNPIISFCAI